MNKFRVLLLLLCITCSVKGWAQRELPSDTLRRSAVMPEVKHFGDYLLDTRLMNVKAAVMKRPTLIMETLCLLFCQLVYTCLVVDNIFLAF